MKQKIVPKTLSKKNITQKSTKKTRKKKKKLKNMVVGGTIREEVIKGSLKGEAAPTLYDTPVPLGKPTSKTVSDDGTKENYELKLVDTLKFLYGDSVNMSIVESKKTDTDNYNNAIKLIKVINGDQL